MSITNPYYKHYAKSNNLTPEAQLTKDKQQYPGGCMAGFILFMHDRRGQFHKETNRKYFSYEGMDDEGCDAFRKWMGL